MQLRPCPILFPDRERLLAEEFFDLNHRRTLFPGFGNQLFKKPADQVVYRSISIQRDFPGCTN